MGLKLSYKNELGEVVIHGGSQGTFRLTSIEGLGLAARDYNTVVYSGYDGQKTVSSRATARCITLGIEAEGEDAAAEVRRALKVFTRGGMLYIQNEDIDRRIYCNQVQIPDITRVLKRKIATFGVQFVCDNPFFEDANNTVVPLYKKNKLLKTTFTLPGIFSKIIVGGDVEIKGTVDVEPIIAIYYPQKLEKAESIVLTNETTGKTIELSYAPQKADMVTIDIKNRQITSLAEGSILNRLTDTSFLGDFVLVSGVNTISVDLGDVTTGFTIECKYNNLYSEAVIV